jgi:hypothetical protein
MTVTYVMSVMLVTSMMSGGAVMSMTALKAVLFVKVMISDASESQQVPKNNPDASILHPFLPGPISKYSTVYGALFHPDHQVTMHHSIMTNMGQCAFYHQSECYISSLYHIDR